MKRIFLVTVCACVALMAYGQEQGDEQVLITDFEEGFDWAWTGGAIVGSLVDFSPIPIGGTEVPAFSGENALFVNYDNAGNGFNWVQLTFPIDPVDLTGMTELRWTTWWDPNGTGTPNYRLEVFGGWGLDVQEAPARGEWVEMVWPIPQQYTSPEGPFSEFTGWGGFWSPGEEDATSMLLMDDMFAVRPEGTPELEEITVYGFNESGDNPDIPAGWQGIDSEVFLALDPIEPTEGSNVAELAVAGSYINNSGTINALNDFDRWDEVAEIRIDFRYAESFTGAWGNVQLVASSGISGLDEQPENVNDFQQLAEQSIAGTETDGWKTLAWVFNPEDHMGAIGSDSPDAFLNFSIVTNEPAEQAGQLLFVDNFRVALPTDTGVEHWNLF